MACISQTQYLAVAAGNIYYVPSEVNIVSYVHISALRLWMDPYATHALAGLLGVVAVLLLVVYIMSARKRRNLCLSAEPGSIAAAAAVLSQSVFARTLIRANMSEKEIEKSLRGMRFGFDIRTWAIEAEAYNADDYLMYSRGGGLTPGEKVVDDKDAEETGLLASQQMEMPQYVSAYPQTPTPGTPGAPATPGIEVRPPSTPPHREEA